jgi:hypothetical protein
MGIAMFDPFLEVPNEIEIMLERLHQKAIEHYEHSLAERSPGHLQNFIEQELLLNPLHLDLLYELLNDLQQRLLALQEYHFDVRERIVRVFLEVYHTDITPLIPADQLHRYHFLQPDQVIEFIRRNGIWITRQEKAVVGDMIRSSTDICGQLYEDIELTFQFIIMLQDWLMAYNINNVRQSQQWVLLPSTDGLALIQ